MKLSITSPYAYLVTFSGAAIDCVDIRGFVVKLPNAGDSGGCPRLGAKAGRVGAPHFLAERLANLHDPKTVHPFACISHSRLSPFFLVIGTKAANENEHLCFQLEAFGDELAAPQCCVVDHVVVECLKVYEF